MKKLLKPLSIFLLALALIGAGFCGCYYLLPPHLYNRGWSDGFNYIKPIEDLQRQVGCEKIDGIWGRETNRLYEKALCNQYAEWSMCSNVRKFDMKMLAKVEK